MKTDAAENCPLCPMNYCAGNFCAKLTTREHADLKANSQTITLNRGQSIPDDALAHWPIFAITAGVLSLQDLLHDGRKTIAAFFMRGDILDLRDATNRKLGSLIALSKVSLCRFSPEVFEQILSANTRARAVAWDGLTSQAFRAISHASDLGKKQALEKLASFIFECRNRGPEKARPDHVEIPIRRRDLAEYLGMQPETVSRCFKELEERSIITVSDLSIIRIENTPALRRIANGHRDAQGGPGRYQGPEINILKADA